MSRSVVHARAIARRRAELNMDCTVAITRMDSPPDYDPTTLMVQARTASPVYTGKAFIHALGGQGDTMIGDAGIPLRTTTISIPAATPEWTTQVPRVDDTVLVTVCDHDPGLVGRVFQVVSVDGGNPVRGTRQLYCTTWGDSNNWEQEGRE